MEFGVVERGREREFSEAKKRSGKDPSSTKEGALVLFRKVRESGLAGARLPCFYQIQPLPFRSSLTLFPLFLLFSLQLLYVLSLQNIIFNQ